MLGAILVALVVLAVVIPGFGRIPARPAVTEVGESIEVQLRDSTPVTLAVTEVEVITAGEHGGWNAEPALAYRHLEGKDLYLIHFTSGGVDTGERRDLWRLADADDETYLPALVELPPEVDCAGPSVGCVPVLVPEGTDIASARYYGLQAGRRQALAVRWAQWNL